MTHELWCPSTAQTAACTHGPGVAWGPHRCKVRCVSVVTNKKIGKLVSDSFERIIQQRTKL